MPMAGDNLGSEVVSASCCCRFGGTEGLESSFLVVSDFVDDYLVSTAGDDFGSTDVSTFWHC